MGIKLLISAQNETEVDKILEDPPEILDLKNPNEGSLGAPPIHIVIAIEEKISQFNTTHNTDVKFSAAIGDFPFLPGTASMAAYGVATLNPDYIKIGLLGPTTKETGIILTQSVVNAVRLVNADIQIVVVGYGDQRKLNLSVNPLYIPEIAFKGGANIAMLDTKIKNGNSLLEYLSISQLGEFVSQCRDMNISSALAGSLKIKDISQLNQIHPDIIGVRSMVCDNFDRVNGEIQPSLIHSLKDRLH